MPQHPGQIDSWVITATRYGGLVTLAQHRVAPSISREVGRVLREDLGVEPGVLIVPESTVEQAGRLIVSRAVLDPLPSR